MFCSRPLAHRLTPGLNPKLVSLLNNINNSVFSLGINTPHKPCFSILSLLSHHLLFILYHHPSPILLIPLWNQNGSSINSLTIMQVLWWPGNSNKFVQCIVVDWWTDWLGVPTHHIGVGCPSAQAFTRREATTWNEYPLGLAPIHTTFLIYFLTQG